MVVGENVGEGSRLRAHVVCARSFSAHKTRLGDGGLVFAAVVLPSSLSISPLLIVQHASKTLEGIVYHAHSSRTTVNIYGPLLVRVFYQPRALWQTLIKLFEPRGSLSIPPTPSSQSSTAMSAKIEVPAPFAPLLKLDLPSPEEYNKRKVALISGES